MGMKLIESISGQRAEPKTSLECRVSVNPVCVNVVFTQPDATRAALKEAARLSQQLSADICLLMAVPVGYPAPLTSAWGRVNAAKVRGRALATSSALPLEVRVFLCRDEAGTFAQYLPPKSIVLVGGPRRWWRSYEQRLATRLAAAGLNALFMNTKEHYHA